MTDLDCLQMMAIVDSAFAQKLPDDEACPRCGHLGFVVEGLVHPFACVCPNCQWTGPREGTDDEPELAVYAWNREIRRIRAAQAMGLKVDLDWEEETDLEGSC